MCAWLRCDSGAGAEPFPSPFNLLSLSWDTKPNVTKNLPANGGSAYWTCQEKTPTITADCIISAYLGNHGGTAGKEYVQVSENGSSWATILKEENEGSNVYKQASLSAYAGKRLFVRCYAINDGLYAHDTSPLYPNTAFQITEA